MKLPKRIQRKRVKGFKLPPNTICINRPLKYGNIFVVGEFCRTSSGSYQKMTLEKCLKGFDNFVKEILYLNPNWLEDLKNADYIACFCKEDSPCHGDILIKWLRYIYGEN